ncbi:MAG: hypothetical protein M1127_00265 [Patescibacteria group bacterium]|nr:hypothetical protein [Patescibacteria group bacterium]
MSNKSVCKATIKEDDWLFYISAETMQEEALFKIGRKLTEDELYTAKKGLESGIGTGLGIIYDTILNEMIEK